MSIAKVTLLRSGSTTHHSDGNQRCVELSFIPITPVEGGNPGVKVFVPSKSSGLLPRGYYMLHLVSTQTVVTQGVPSVALWVRIV